MKKQLQICILILISYGTNGQGITINKYLNGIWTMKCCDKDYWIFYNNKLYWVNENTARDKLADQYYCFPKANYFPETKYGLNYKKNLKPDSLDYDRPFRLIDGEEIVEIVFYDAEDVLSNGNIKHTGPDYYQINPTKTNYFYGWGHANSQNLVYYDRVITPANFLIDFYKRVAKSGFKKLSALKVYINSIPNKPTKMYLIKGDEVEILEEKGEWLKIRYYGKKVVEGWIKRSGVD